MLCSCQSQINLLLHQELSLTYAIELLADLNRQGFYTQGYADDLVILIQGFDITTMMDLMSSALKKVEQWCIKVGLTINPTKAELIIFTRKRRLGNVVTPTLFGKELTMSDQVKYLGVILDKKLNWTPHLNKVIKRSRVALMTSRATLGKSWGLNPRIMLWLYNTVVKPMITYCSLVWWPKTEQKHAVSLLTKIQRLACLCVTGAMSSGPTAGMEMLLGLPPLDLVIVGEARLASHRLRLGAGWVGRGAGHSRILHNLKLPILDMHSDTIPLKYSFEKPFKTRLKGSETNEKAPDLVWFTDGSKMLQGAGAGICGLRPRAKISIPLGIYATVFQAEVLAISECARRMTDKGYSGKRILICSDSQAALNAIQKYEIRSRTVWECIQNLLTLARRNSIELEWVRGHAGIEGNEAADRLARAGSETHIIGPEPVLGITKNNIRNAVSEWINTQHRRRWMTTSGQRHGKLMLRNMSVSLTREYLNLNRNNARLIVGIVTGHCHLRKHMHRIGINKDNPICRVCGEEDETASHIIFTCGGLASLRHRIFGSATLETLPREKFIINKLLQFLRGGNLLK